MPGSTSETAPLLPQTIPRYPDTTIARNVMHSIAGVGFIASIVFFCSGLVSVASSKSVLEPSRRMLFVGLISLFLFGLPLLGTLIRSCWIASDYLFWLILGGPAAGALLSVALAPKGMKRLFVFGAFTLAVVVFMEF